ncbi:MAG: signal recognition particle-docking protein FtsY [Gammaproteobacteria bacterium]|nr:signal recognition particle-docking protein FtsY [Gammaproteobacteria bacterium]MBT4494721.1 signal recognition particle-docking protein FtsY [Gammaproteobacteria bacterium]MBT7370904.1 signal recognition particle-docking protein FtsY [Gammaproteobacteria bacterium]
MAADVAEEESEDKKGFFARLKSGLSKTRSKLSEGLQDVFLGAKSLDDELMEDIEAILLSSDVGVTVTQEILDELTQKISRKELTDGEAVFQQLQAHLTSILKPVEQVFEVGGASPFVILMVGVNGAGKTTTIGKLAKRLQNEGHSVMLAAGDTFRAAAVEQLKVWGDRNDVPVVAQETGADAASVIFDALSAAKARKVDVLIADTAGRLQNKKNLMDELAKINRVMKKIDGTAPHEIMLVLDAATGQNAISQASEFFEAVDVSGLTLTKLDGTAKGGVIFAIARQLALPIRFVAVGEKIEDLRPFSAEDFVSALFQR